jgi:hypothetical protein
MTISVTDKEIDDAVKRCKTPELCCIDKFHPLQA